MCSYLGKCDAFQFARRVSRPFSFPVQVRSSPPLPFHPSTSFNTMSADLHTGKTPLDAAKSAHKSSLSVTMAPAIEPFGNSTHLSPEEYRKRKVALITGESPSDPLLGLLACISARQARSFCPRVACRVEPTGLCPGGLSRTDRHANAGITSQVSLVRMDLI